MCLDDKGREPLNDLQHMNIAWRRLTPDEKSASTVQDIKEKAVELEAEKEELRVKVLRALKFNDLVLPDLCKIVGLDTDDNVLKTVLNKLILESRVSKISKASRFGQTGFHITAEVQPMLEVYKLTRHDWGYLELLFKRWRNKAKKFLHDTLKFFKVREQ